MSKEIDQTDIPDIAFQGYYWYSNNQDPHLLRQEKIDTKIFTYMPFIVEGNFYNKDKEISIQVKCIDGEYKFYRYDLKGYNKKEYLSIGRLKKEFPRYQMVEAWEDSTPISEDPQQDPLAGMTSSQPAWSAFAGFLESQ